MPRDGNEVECITLSDTDSQTSSETDDRLAGNGLGEIFQYTRIDANVEDEITNDEGYSLDNNSLIVMKLPVTLLKHLQCSAMKCQQHMHRFDHEFWRF